MNAPILPADGPPFSMDEAKAMLGCEEDAIIERIRAGELWPVKFGRSFVFPRRAFYACLEEIAAAEARKRRAEFDARGKATTVINQAKKPGRGARAVPALPQLPR